MGGRRRKKRQSPGFTVPEACDLLEEALSGDARSRILDTYFPGGSHFHGDPSGLQGGFPAALGRFRSALGSHIFRIPPDPLTLKAMVSDLDRRTRLEGFHVLQAWDHLNQRFTPDNLPVLLLDYYTHLREGREGRVAPAILLDFYFLHLLALVVMRVWDGADPDALLDRVQHLLDLLQGPQGSGHHFVAGPATLMILAVSHFHPRDSAYVQLIERIRTLGPRHRLDFALVSAGVLGSHLRWGISQMYEWDVPRMRRDNVGDYPWLLFTAVTLLDACIRLHEAGDPEWKTSAASLLNALSADPGAFHGEPPPALEPHGEEHAGFVERFAAFRPHLRVFFEALRPSDEVYSPLSFHFNFPHNTVVARTTIALMDGEPGNLPLDALLVSDGGSADGVEGTPVSDPRSDPRRSLARALMHYAGARPERLEARGARLILYDAHSAARSHRAVMEELFGGQG